MNRYRLLLVLVSVLLMSANAHSALVNVGSSLVNPSFELPGTGKINTGFDDPANNVPGWNSAMSQDCGVEMSWVKPIPDGEWAAYIMGSEGPVWQTSSAVIADGKTYSLDYWLANTGSWWSVSPPDAVSVPIPMVMLYADNGTNKIPLAIEFPKLAAGNTWAQYNISYVANTSFVGYKVGVQFDNLNGTGVGATPPWENNCWMGVDIVPEPATIALLGIGALSLLRRRSA